MTVTGWSDHGIHRATGPPPPAFNFLHMIYIASFYLGRKININYWLGWVAWWVVVNLDNLEL